MQGGALWLWCVSLFFPDKPTGWSLFMNLFKASLAVTLHWPSGKCQQHWHYTASKNESEFKESAASKWKILPDKSLEDIIGQTQTKLLWPVEREANSVQHHTYRGTKGLFVFQTLGQWRLLFIKNDTQLWTSEPPAELQHRRKQKASASAYCISSDAVHHDFSRNWSQSCKELNLVLRPSNSFKDDCNFKHCTFRVHSFKPNKTHQSKLNYVLVLTNLDMD